MVLAGLIYLFAWSVALAFILKSIALTWQYKKLHFYHPIFFGFLIFSSLSLETLIGYYIVNNFAEVKGYLYTGLASLAIGLLLGFAFNKED